jgi:hypothetical protein
MNGPLLRAVRPRLAIPGSADAGADQATHGERHGDRDPAERELAQAREEHRPTGQAAHGHAAGQQRDGGGPPMESARLPSAALALPQQRIAVVPIPVSSHRKAH